MTKILRSSAYLKIKGLKHSLSIFSWVWLLWLRKTWFQMRENVIFAAMRRCFMLSQLKTMNKFRNIFTLDVQNTMASRAECVMKICVRSQKLIPILYREWKSSFETRYTTEWYHSYHSSKCFEKRVPFEEESLCAVFTSLILMVIICMSLATLSWHKLNFIFERPLIEFIIYYPPKWKKEHIYLDVGTKGRWPKRSLEWKL